jgi:serine/threonine-protein phosphatase 2A activator
MLDDISGVKKWEKVNEGMFKMYRAEVLNKLPIMQHFLFGSIIQFEGSLSADFNEEMEHVHAFGQQNPACCTIRVPGLVAVKKMRALPFD